MGEEGKIIMREKKRWILKRKDSPQRKGGKEQKRTI